MKVVLRKCCISQVQVGAIISSANVNLAGNALPNYWRHMGRKNVDGVVHKLGGSKLKLALSKCKVPLEMGDVAVTAQHSTRLVTDHIFHCVCPDYLYGVHDQLDLEDKYSRMVGAILLAADSKNISSIAVPALGCGVKGWPAAKAAKLSLDTLQHFRGVALSSVTFALLDANVYNVWTTVCKKYHGAPDQDGNTECCWNDIQT